jgi:cephalosporin-C deacetylase
LAGQSAPRVVPTFEHQFPFDPTYGYDLERLLQVTAPPEPEGFAPFWQGRFREACRIDPSPRVTPAAIGHPRFRVFDLEYRSTDGITIKGWFVEPADQAARCGFVLGHGYGGIEAPDLDLPRPDGAYIIPCFRGLSRSRLPGISDNPSWHVLHAIDKRDRYILGGCVEDLWLAVSALVALRPALAGHVGYMGISFGGGVGALAVPWDDRVQRVHLNVPSFGHHPLRTTLPTVGSAAAVTDYQKCHGHVLKTLSFYDAAVAVGHLRQPAHIAVALFDPAVAPPGQFAVYNAIPGPKSLFVLAAGHFDWPGRAEQEEQLRTELKEFFAAL